MARFSSSISSSTTTSSTPAKLPSSQRAIVEDAAGKPHLAKSIPLPLLLPGTVLIKTEVVALNPSDHKMGAAFPTPGAVVGMDFAGSIVAIHKDTKTNFRIGERVCGIVHGSNPAERANGAFAEYVRAKPELVLRVPQGLPMEEAATLCTGLSTNLLALWVALALEAHPESPAEKPLPVLVYGGSTATGTLAIQLLKLSGLDAIVTCSERNFDLVRSYGASAVFDYTRPGVAEEIKKYTAGRLRHAYDCITDADSVACCYAALGRPGGRYACLELCPEELQTRRAVKAEMVLGYDVFGEEVPLSGGYERPADKQKHAAAVRWFGVFQRLLDEGKVKPHPTQKLEGGLEAVLQGLQMLKSGSVSGKKLVASVA